MIFNKNMENRYSLVEPNDFLKNNKTKNYIIKITKYQLKYIFKLFHVIATNSILLLILLTFAFKYQVNSSKNIKIKYFNFENEIIMTIKGNGAQKIFSDYFEFLYDNYDSRNYKYDIYVNDILQNYRDKKVYNLINNINVVKVIFNYRLLSCKSMFYGLYNNIIKIDLSKFDSSKVTDMSSMFSSCYDLSSLNLSNLNTSKVTNMIGMFYYCKSLTSLDLLSFDTSSVKDMYIMFYCCLYLKYLCVDNFDTSLVTDMSSMFEHCESLLSLNLINFNTSSVYTMDSMFYYCSDIISLEIGNFDTSKVVNMEYMFYYCKSLISLNLESFDTSSVTRMYCMFENCKSLISLNINNFNTTNVTSMSYMFYYCDSLISLNLNNFTISKGTYYTNMIYSYKSNTTYCINDKIKSLFKDYSPLKNNCSSLCFTNPNHKLIKEKNECINNCSYDSEYIYEYKGICYKSCPPRTNNSINNYYICINFTCDKYYNYEQKNCTENVS